MKLSWLLGLLIPAVTLLGCSSDSSLSAIAPASDDAVALQSVPCVEPGPAPLLPTSLQTGTLLTDGRVLGSFSIQSGPFLRPDRNGCPQWVVGSELTVTLDNQERKFFTSDLAVPLNRRTVFREEPGPECRSPIGSFTFNGSASGRWRLLELRCNLSSNFLLLTGTYTSGVALP